MALAAMDSHRIGYTGWRRLPDGKSDTGQKSEGTIFARGMALPVKCKQGFAGDRTGQGIAEGFGGQGLQLCT